ncbi:MAG: hypothetical protein P8Y03_18130 [Anaerolineales bacterium]
MAIRRESILECGKPLDVKVFQLLSQAFILGVRKPNRWGVTEQALCLRYAAFAWGRIAIIVPVRAQNAAAHP